MKATQFFFRQKIVNLKSNEIEMNKFSHFATKCFFVSIPHVKMILFAATCEAGDWQNDFTCKTNRSRAKTKQTLNQFNQKSASCCRSPHLKCHNCLLVSFDCNCKSVTHRRNIVFCIFAHVWDSIMVFRIAVDADRNFWFFFRSQAEKFKQSCFWERATEWQKKNGV